MAELKAVHDEVNKLSEKDRQEYVNRCSSITQKCKGDGAGLTGGTMIDMVTNETFKNKVWIAEFFFATCPTICPIMNSQLKNLNKETKKYADHIQFLSFTINPINDKPSVLKKYRKKHGIDAANWAFLTGDEAATHRLGIENFQVFAGRDAEAEGGYAHSGSFTLVDKKGYVRGVYAVTNFDGTVNKTEYQRLKNELIQLLKYEYNIEK
jgi:protein SCO1/2